MQSCGFPISSQVNMFLSVYRSVDLCLSEVPALVCGLFSGRRAEKYLTVKRQKTAAVLEHFHTG